MIVLAPIARSVPATLYVAVPFDPEAANDAVPSVVPGILKVTVPDGGAVPLAGVIVTVRVVAEFTANDAALAVALAAVDTVTVTAADPDELLKFESPP